MPNHIKNRLTIVGDYDQIVKVFEKYNHHIPASLSRANNNWIICEDKNRPNEFTIGWFDLATGIFTNQAKEESQGLPEGWGLVVNQATDHFPDFRKIRTPPDDPAYRDEPNQELARSNPNWWLTWNNKNWGTKWNSYDNEKEKYNVFIFETAWSGVPDLMQEMSKQNPDIEFHYEYSDEDTGCNCGEYKFINGKITHEFLPQNQSKDAYEIAFRLRPESKEWYELNGDSYDYKED